VPEEEDTVGVHLVEGQKLAKSGPVPVDLHIEPGLLGRRTFAVAHAGSLDTHHDEPSRSEGTHERTHGARIVEGGFTRVRPNALDKEHRRFGLLAFGNGEQRAKACTAGDDVAE